MSPVVAGNVSKIKMTSGRFRLTSVGERSWAATTMDRS